MMKEKHPTVIEKYYKHKGAEFTEEELKRYQENDIEFEDDSMETLNALAGLAT